jgi:ADP-ribose pyrophosphatase YjhB (NUDIX family)
MAQTTVYVGTVVLRDDRILLVRQSKGHALAGQWTIPWGKVEAAESPMAAASRETREEGGVTVAVEGFLGVQELPAPQTGGIALVYLCRHVDGAPAPRDAETDAARYFSAADLDALPEPIEPWSAWLVRRALGHGLTVIGRSTANPLQEDGAFL